MVLTRRTLIPTGLLLIAFAVALLSFGSIAQAVQPGVSELPRTNTTQVRDGEVLDTLILGNRVFLAGTFTQVQDTNGTTHNQAYLAAYNVNTGRFDTSFRPQFDNFVNSIDTNGYSIFAGGQFDTVDGEAHRRLAKISSDGSVNSRFQASASATVNSVAVANNKLYVGGRFTLVSGQPREAFAAVNLTTGAADSQTNFDFAGNSGDGPIAVRWLEASPNRQSLFATHSARTIDGQTRTGIAKFDISATNTSLSNWQTLQYENELERLFFTLRMRRLAISPDGSYVVVVTGSGDRPPAADTATRFPTNGGANVQANWVSRHFDTVLGVAISGDAVYVGGHFQFQEAPGSPNPFPGDQFTDFGFGDGQGPVQLGSQVVRREQLGALDPATGKSLDWNPGSDSFIGVQSLTWSDQYGLLVGHDGNRLGNQANIGRHGIFPISSAQTGGGGDAGGNGNLACTVTTNGNNATISFTGDTGSSVNLRRNGSWNQTVIGTSATVSGGAGDNYVARVRGPNYGDFADITCTGGGAGGAGAITTTITSPVSGGVVDGGTLTISGQATAQDGLQMVRLAIVRRATGEYLNADGSYTAAWAPIDVNLNSTSANWSVNVNLEFAGEFDITARTFDVDGDRNEPIRRSFVVGNLSNTPPTNEVFGPFNTITTNSVRIFGNATDDVSVQSVRFLLQNLDTFEYFRPNGSLGEAQFFFPTLSNPGGTSTDWEETVFGLPDGSWQMTSDVFDSSGQRVRRIVNFIKE